MSPGKGSYFTSYRTYPFPYISPGVFAHAPDFGRMVALIRKGDRTTTYERTEFSIYFSGLFPPGRTSLTQPMIPCTQDTTRKSTVVSTATLYFYVTYGNFNR